MAFRRLIATGLPISPRARARLLGGFLGVNLVAALLGQAQRLGWLGDSAWIGQLDSSPDGTLADWYSVVIWSAVAVLALAQLCRTRFLGRQRLFEVLGWLGVALIATLLAFEEGVALKDRLPDGLAAAVYVPGLPPSARWLTVVAPLLAAPLAAAGWVLLTSQRGHPARALVTLVAAVVAATAIAQDAVGTFGATLSIGAVPSGADTLHITQISSGHLEEGAEVMAAAALVVVLIEMLATRSGAGNEAPRLASSSRKCGRRAVTLAVAAAVLIASVFPLLTRHTFAGYGWEQGPPLYYAGPISLVEQRFRANHDNLQRIDVWAYVDSGSTAEPAEIFARLTPVHGSERPIRESRAEVNAARFSNATVAFEFEPIPDSAGKSYTLAVGVLSGPTPYVFLGLTDGELMPEASAVVNGAPTPNENDLALRTAWSGSFLTTLLQMAPAHWVLICEVTLFVFLWVVLVVTAWQGMSGRRPHVWRRFVWPTMLTSTLITAGIFVVALAFLTLRSITQVA